MWDEPLFMTAMTFFLTEPGRNFQMKPVAFCIAPTLKRQSVAKSEGTHEHNTLSDER